MITQYTFFVILNVRTTMIKQGNIMIDLGGANIEYQPAIPERLVIPHRITVRHQCP